MGAHASGVLLGSLNSLVTLLAPPKRDYAGTRPARTVQHRRRPAFRRRPAQRARWGRRRRTATRSASGHIRAGLAAQLSHPPRHLLARHILHVRRDGPPVPERIDDVPVPVTVELVLRGAV